MSILYSRQKTSVARRQKWQAMLFFVLVIFFIGINTSFAQHTNLSDWHVPPPAPPGNITKGNTTGKDARNSPIVLIPVDIPAPESPKGPAIQLSQSVFVSTSAPVISAPEQPVTAGAISVPFPGAPATPSMPQLQLQDLQAATDMPDPAAPELPSLPAEPLPSQTMTTNTRIPVMPAIIERLSVVFPADAVQSYFPTPSMPENSRENINIPPATVNDKERVKPKKIKSTKNKPNRQQ